MATVRESVHFVMNHEDLPFPSGKARPGSLPVLPHATQAGLDRVASLLVTRQGLWSPLAQRLLEGDGAAATRIASLGGWEAWLHVWPPGSSSVWHRHAGPTTSAVLMGQVRESRAGGTPDATGRTGARRHALLNETAEPAVTLHVYGLATPYSGRDEAARCRPTSGRLAMSAREAS
jgi:hypothetical protein